MPPKSDWSHTLFKLIDGKYVCQVTGCTKVYLERNAHNQKSHLLHQHGISESSPEVKRLLQSNSQKHLSVVKVLWQPWEELVLMLAESYLPFSCGKAILPSCCAACNA